MPVQGDLFAEPVENKLQRDVLGIKGLWYLPGILSKEEEQQVLDEVDSQPWQNDLKRRVQHYGYKYDYKARSIDHSMYVGGLPPFAIAVAEKLTRCGLIEEMPDQLIVNEYQPGQGITAHIDCEPCFKNTIVTVSLGSNCEMDFIHVSPREDQHVLLERRSALMLRDEARYDWMHQIKARKSDNGMRRDRRVSLTFRSVIIEDDRDES